MREGGREGGNTQAITQYTYLWIHSPSRRTLHQTYPSTGFHVQDQDARHAQGSPGTGKMLGAAVLCLLAALFPACLPARAARDGRTFQYSGSIRGIQLIPGHRHYNHTVMTIQRVPSHRTMRVLTATDRLNPAEGYMSPLSGSMDSHPYIGIRES